ncbi:MAG: membrane protein insertion efficiency factor YidD [Candidatus Omnitrophota bacterium]|jgi:putative membrane protein insertion efficiency factor
MKIIVAFIFQCYRAVISPFFGPACRFTPTCSHYAEEAILKKGLLRGGADSVVRILKCHPFHPGGYDPVKE